MMHAISSLKEGSTHNKKVNPKIMETQITTTDPWTMYIYSLKSPVSKQKYPKRLAKLFAFAGLPNSSDVIIFWCPHPSKVILKLGCC